MTALVAALAALGIVTMLSRRPWQTVAICATAGAAGVASVLGKYPFQGRFILFAVPLLLLLVAAGVGAIWSTQINSLRLATLFVLALLVLYPGGVAISHAIEPRRMRNFEMSSSRSKPTGGRMTSCMSAAQRSSHFVTTLNATSVMASTPGPLRELILKSRTRGRDALQSNPPSLIVGNIYNNTQYETYLSDFARLRNHDRVWLVFSFSLGCIVHTPRAGLPGPSRAGIRSVSSNCVSLRSSAGRSNGCLNP